MKGFEKKEAEKERGNNVTVHLVFVRHGEKEISTTTAETGLTEEGRDMSREFGKGLEEREVIKAYSSDTERTKETADEIVATSPTQRKQKRAIRKDLAFHSSPEGAFYQEVMKMKEEVLDEGFESLPEHEKNKRLHKLESKQTDYYLSFGDKRPDSTTLSPVETAAMIARRVDLYMRMSKRMYSGSNVELINTSHDFNLSAFLSQVLIREVDGQSVTGFESVEEVGGPTAYLEGFEVLIKTDEKGERSLKFLFRDREYDIDLERLDQLSKIALEMENKELGIKERK